MRSLTKVNSHIKMCSNYHECSAVRPNCKKIDIYSKNRMLTITYMNTKLTAQSYIILFSCFNTVTVNCDKQGLETHNVSDLTVNKCTHWL